MSAATETASSSNANANTNTHNSVYYQNALDTLWGASLSIALTLANYKVFVVAYFILCCLINLLSLRNSLLINCFVSILSNYQTWSIKSLIICTASSMISSKLIDRRFKKSFKLGENILLSQLISKLVLICFDNRFRGWSGFFLLSNLLPIVKEGSFVTNSTWLVLCAAFTLNREIVHVLISEISSNFQLIIYWIFLLSAVLYLPLAFPYSPIFSNQNSMRKFYHFSAVALFIPAAFWCSNVLKISLATASTLFIHLETVRFDYNEKRKGKGKFRDNYFMEVLNSFMERCRNDLDKGEMILSHLYLLLGCSIPFWLTNNLNISSFSGIISLGIGDSLASIGGKALGQTRWHRLTSKTMEGSLCACMGMFFAWITLNQLGSFKVSLKHLFIFSFWPALWEALIDLNDNLTLPIFTFILINYCT